MQDEKLAEFVPDRLNAFVSLGLCGHHPLFEREAILAAFAAPDAPVARDDATAVGQALIAIIREPVNVARRTVSALPRSAQLALVRLYFRLLDRAQQERPLRH